ncbi:MAG: hypothetical protein ACI814_003368, partial [Mariniblastus sp.]
MTKLIDRFFSMATLLAAALLLVSHPTSVSGQEHDLSDEAWKATIRDDLSMAVSEWLRYEKAEIVYSTAWETRYWVGTFRAVKAGDFKLISTMQEDVPAAGDSIRIEFVREFQIGPRGSTRTIFGAGGRSTYVNPLVCVGDYVQIPIRIKRGLDHDHRFKFSDKPYVKPKPYSRTTNLKAADFFTSKNFPEKFRVGGELAKSFELAQGIGRQFTDQTRKRWYADLEPVLRVKPELKLERVRRLTVSTRFDFGLEEGHRESRYPVEIVGGKNPITAMASQWKLYYEYRGERSERGAESLTMDVAMMRPGDLLVARSAEYPGVINESQWDEFPILQLEKIPFSISRPGFL